MCVCVCMCVCVKINPAAVFVSLSLLKKKPHTKNKNKTTKHTATNNSLEGCGVTPPPPTHSHYWSPIAPCPLHFTFDCAPLIATSWQMKVCPPPPPPIKIQLRHCLKVVRHDCNLGLNCSVIEIVLFIHLTMLSHGFSNGNIRASHSVGNLQWPAVKY